MTADLDSHPTVLILATPHLSDFWVEDREAEAKEVVDRLSQFKPTVVAVEVRPKNESQIRERYEQFRKKAESLGTSEIDQIAFRLAQLCDIPSIRGFDADWQLTWDGLRKLYPKEADLEAAFVRVTRVSAPALGKLRDLIASGASLRDLLLWVNSPEYQKLGRKDGRLMGRLFGGCGSRCGARV